MTGHHAERDASIDPELLPLIGRAELRLPHWLAQFAVTHMPVPRSSKVSVTTAFSPSGNRLRIYVPRGARSGAGMLWVHGGGLMFGDARQDEALCLSTAERLGVLIVSANYRVAPKHPFPAAHDDVHESWTWFLDHAAGLEVDPARIAIAGESAGGGLAAAVAQRIRDEGGQQPVCQWLFAPMLDDRTAADTSLDARRHRVWDNVKNRQGWTGYLSQPPGHEVCPAYAVAARCDDLTGLPPAFLSWGDVELFADECQVYADRLRGAGVPVTTDVVSGAPHGFENWAHETEIAQALIGRAQDWLGRYVGATSGAAQD